jgi:hypothetical protein
MSRFSCWSFKSFQLAEHVESCHVSLQEGEESCGRLRLQEDDAVCVKWAATLIKKGCKLDQGGLWSP